MSDTNSLNSNARIAEQAAHWVVTLDTCSTEQYQRYRLEYEAWKQAAPLHAEAAKRTESFLDRISSLRDGGSHGVGAALKAVETALQREQKQRRHLLTTTLSLLLISISITLVQQHWPLTHLGADIRAGTGQWQESILEDGSHITLAGKSVVDVDFSGTRRTQRLLAASFPEIQVRTLTSWLAVIRRATTTS